MKKFENSANRKEFAKAATCLGTVLNITVSGHVCRGCDTDESCVCLWRELMSRVCACAES